MERVLGGKSYDIVLDGPVIPVQVQINSGSVAAANAIAFPSTIAATASFTTGTKPIAIQGLVHFALAGVLSQNGIITVQPYLDMAGAVPVGSTFTASATASSGFVIDNNVGTICVQSIGVTIHNSGSVAATLSNPVLVLQSS